MDLKCQPLLNVNTYTMVFKLQICYSNVVLKPARSKETL